MFFNYSVKSIHFLAANFFEFLPFLADVVLLDFLAVLPAVLVDVLPADVDDEPAAVVAAAAVAGEPSDDLATFLTFDLAALAVFFFGEAAFFFEPFALAFPVAFGFVDVFDFGLAVPAAFGFLAVDAFFLGVVAGATVAAVVSALDVAAVLLLAVAIFFAEVFLVGDGERFRFVVPLAPFDLVDDEDFFVFVPLDFLLPLDAFDLPVDFVEADFLLVFFL